MARKQVKVWFDREADYLVSALTPEPLVVAL